MACPQRNQCLQRPSFHRLGHKKKPAQQKNDGRRGPSQMGHPGHDPIQQTTLEMAIHQLDQKLIRSGQPGCQTFHQSSPPSQHPWWRKKRAKRKVNKVLILEKINTRIQHWWLPWCNSSKEDISIIPSPTLLTVLLCNSTGWFDFPDFSQQKRLFRFRPTEAAFPNDSTIFYCWVASVRSESWQKLRWSKKTFCSFFTP